MSLIDDRGMEVLTRSFLLGTARHPLPVGAMPEGLALAKGSTPELAALALIGQRLRFRRHGPPPAPEKVTPIEDERRIVPEAARPLMRRLVAGKGGSASDIAALALADICLRLRLRPHPFDLPRLEAFANAHGEALGAGAAAFAARGDKDEERPRHYFDADRIDAGNWSQARPPARAAFIASMRMREPDRARELVEASFTADPAPVRARLLEALARGLSAADTPFLESLDKDRAPSVREAAQRLLRLIPGSISAQARIGDLVQRVKVSSTGLFRKRTKLALELPANLRASPQGAPAAEAGRRWAAEEYTGIGLEAIATAFGLAAADLIEAASDDAPLLALLARQASIDRRFDLLTTMTRQHAADAWTDAVGTSAGGINEFADDAAAEAWCAAAIAPDLWRTMPSAIDLERLYVFLRRPLPHLQALELLRSRAFAAIAGASSPQGVVGRLVLAVAALTPSPLRQELRDVVASLPPEETARAALLLDCLARLDPPSS